MRAEVRKVVFVEEARGMKERPWEVQKLCRKREFECEHSSAMTLLC